MTEKYKIELELSLEEIKGLKNILCAGLLVGDEGRINPESYMSGANLVKIINEKFNYKQDDLIIMNEKDTFELIENTLKPYIRRCVTHMYKIELKEV